MEGFGFVCALVLAAVFVWAAAAKFARPNVTTEGFRSLRLPAPGGLAWGVPAAEVVTAVLLVAVPPAGGVVALVLLAAFSLVIARALRLGLTTPCGCFGATSAKPVSSRDLVRNGLLACLALAALVAAS